MPSALFRVQVPGAGVRLARGTIEGGPADLLDPDLRIDALLSADAEAISLALRDEPSHGDCPADARILAPIENQEVWCTGLTYERTYERPTGRLGRAVHLLRPVRRRAAGALLQGAGLAGAGPG